MPSFSDIAQRLGEMATGLTVGTLEREQADRAEARTLTNEAIQQGARGIDVAPFYTPDMLRPMNAPVLERLQQASGGLTPDTPADVLMLQRPFAEGLVREQTRLQEQRTAQEQAEERRLQQAHDLQENSLDAQDRRIERREELLRQRQRTPIRRDELSASDWRVVEQQVAHAVEAGLQAQEPELMTATPRGLVVTPRFQGVRSSVIHEVTQRLPMHMPRDPASRGALIERITNDVIQGVTRTVPNTFWGNPNPSASTLNFNPQHAVPRRDYSPLVPDAARPPARAPGTPPSPDPGQAARAQQVLRQYGPLIEPAAREFGVPAQVIASIIVPESNGRPGAVSPVSPASGQQAFGLMQLEPPTYAQIAREIGEAGRGSITDPASNIRVGTAYLSRMLRQYQGNYTLALAAYNWGPDNVNRILRQLPAGAPRSEILARLPVSTQNYLASIGGALGGWDASGASFVGLTGQVPNAPTGAASADVVQTAPTPAQMGSMQTVINRFVEIARTRIFSTTGYERRREAKEAALAEAQIQLRRNYAPFADWAMDQLRTRLREIN